MTTWLMLTIAGVCLLLEAFFAGAEMAIVSADRIAMRTAAEHGARAEGMVADFQEAPQRLLATTQLGNNLAVAVASIVVTLYVLDRWPHRASLVTVGVLAPTLLLFAEIVPKTILQQNADRWAPRVIRPLRAVSLLLRPLVIAVSAVSSLFTRLLRVGETGSLVTREELILLLRGSAASPEISEQERRMIARVFAFSDRTVDDILLPLSGVTALAEDATVGEAVQEIADKQHSRIPVYRERVDQIVGILYAFDLLSAKSSDARLAEIARPAVFVPGSMPAVDLLVQLQREGVGMAVVVDEYGGAVGVVTVEDILEEVVGEIEDEFDRAPSPIRQEAPHVYRVRAQTEIAAVNRALRTELPESEDYQTIAGLILDRLKRIPRAGEELRVGGVVISVIAATERSVGEVRIRTARR